MCGGGGGRGGSFGGGGGKRFVARRGSAQRREARAGTGGALGARACAARSAGARAAAASGKSAPLAHRRGERARRAAATGPSARRPRPYSVRMRPDAARMPGPSVVVCGGSFDRRGRLSPRPMPARARLHPPSVGCGRRSARAPAGGPRRAAGSRDNVRADERITFTIWMCTACAAGSRGSCLPLLTVVAIGGPPSEQLSRTRSAY